MLTLAWRRPPALQRRLLLLDAHTGLAPATGSAAPTPMHALVEQPGRAETGERHGDGRSPCRSRLGQLAAASLAERIGAWVARRPSEAMPLRLAGNIRCGPPNENVPNR
eukprot:1634978-Prymnesium_polylepis.1